MCDSRLVRRCTANRCRRQPGAEGGCAVRSARTMGETRSHGVSLVSVVVIGLNEEERLRDSLEAGFANKPRGIDIEVIYVDSGSTDRSVQIASAVPGVQVLHLPGPERSAARARNFGL